jgi:hypothetical protein
MMTLMHSTLALPDVLSACRVLSGSQMGVLVKVCWGAHRGYSEVRVLVIVMEGDHGASNSMDLICQ